ASFVNPHDIVLFPLWKQRGMPDELAAIEVPPVPPARSATEDLRTKPAAHVAYRAAYPSCYGPPGPVAKLYRDHAQEYRDLYYKLHAAVDAPLDRVRRAVTDHTTGDALLVRTADHGDLLGSHGGLHQKWFQLYDESSRVPCSIVRVGTGATTGRMIDEPTSHVDLVPTLLAAASIDEATVADDLRATFSEVHPLPGRNLLPVVDGADPDADRVVYVMTRDNMPEGDTGANAIARAFGRVDDAPGPLRIQVAAHVATNFEGVVARVPSDAGGDGRLWKLVRTFDDPSTWTEPGVRQLASDGIGGPQYRTNVLPDQWELYDLEADPGEIANRWDDPDAAAVFGWMRDRMKEQRHASIPERNAPWPYVTSKITRIDKVPLLPPRDVIKMQVQQRRAGRAHLPKPPQKLARRLLQRLGMHPDDPDAVEFDLAGKRALVIATNHGRLDIGTPTGVFASELTVPYYAFLDAGMRVDVASPLGGDIPVDPKSLKPPIRTSADDRLLADDDLQEALADSLAIGDLDMDQYDIVYLAGGWGAAFDLGTSDDVGRQISAANARGAAIGGVCHGPLGLLKATNPDGTPLVAGRRISAVTDKQVLELGIASTPQHPETELRKAGAEFECTHAFRDPFANHWVVDGNLVTGQNQNAAPMVARELMRLVE
ncbi:MAG: sulfatase-like hydrolase/transferase, partial [Ilumatobacter sp.]|nr:sulfatase-like hydrolase/transferase [Ilumatobacter sp.]